MGIETCCSGTVLHSEVDSHMSDSLVMAKVAQTLIKRSVQQEADIARLHMDIHTLVYLHACINTHAYINFTHMHIHTHAHEFPD